MPRTLVRTLTTFASSLLLLVLTALPALAASAATKPDPAADPYAIGSMPQLGTTAIVGIVLGLLAFAIMDRAPKTDDHH